MRMIPLFVVAALSFSLPASAQNVPQLKQENARLKAQIEQLQRDRCESPSASQNSWNEGGLSAHVDSIRIGRDHVNSKVILVTTTITIRNTGSAAIPVNYKISSFKLVDNNGYAYKLTGAISGISGIPVATESKVDPTSLIAPGASRRITFSTERNMRDGETPGRLFDLNASFIQVQDMGQGQVRKVRDYSTGFTNVAVSSL